MRHALLTPAQRRSSKQPQGQRAYRVRRFFNPKGAAIHPWFAIGAISNQSIRLRPRAGVHTQSMRRSSAAQH